MKLRHMLMTAALLGSAGLVLFGDPPQNPSGIVAPTVQPTRNAFANTVSQAPQQAIPATPSTTAMQLLARASRDYDTASSAIRAENATRDLFAAHDWAPPPPPRPRSEPLSPESTAPAVPFTLIGKHQSDGKWEIFLTSGKNNYVVHEQDIVNEQYKIESIRPPVMTLIYLPLNTKQTMQIGDFE